MVVRLEALSFAPCLSKNQPEVGHLIRELRQRLGYTQEQFAVVLGVSFTTLNCWENGRMQPSPPALRQMEGVLAQRGQSSNPVFQESCKTLLAKYTSANS